MKLGESHHETQLRIEQVQEESGFPAQVTAHAPQSHSLWLVGRAGLAPPRFSLICPDVRS